MIPLSPSVERVVCVAAVGGHHLLLLGPRGSGKSHALDWRTALEPPSDPRSRVRHQLLCELREGHSEPPREAVPIRRVSSQVRPAALIGRASGDSVLPGEFTLSSGGILIADELPEWQRDSREVLREPLERGMVMLSRARTHLELPAQFTLAASGNLCPCGGWPPGVPIPGPIQLALGGRRQLCRCRPAVRASYLARLSGPILDRIDLISLSLPAHPAASSEPSTDSRLAECRERVSRVRQLLGERWGALPGRLSPALLERLLREHRDWRNCLSQLRCGSLRSRHKTLRVALSLAAWDDQELPSEACFFEASTYRAESLGLMN